MAEEIFEAVAVEEDDDGSVSEPAPEAHPLAEADRGGQELSVWKGEVRTAALVAAGGIVVGAATVAAVRATRGGGRRIDRRIGLGRDRNTKVIASRSFLVDVHLLGR